MKQISSSQLRATHVSTNQPVTKACGIQHACSMWIIDITAQHALVPYLRSSWLTKALLGHACDVWLKRATCIIAAPMLTTPLQGCTAVITGRMLQPPLMHCPAYLGPMFAQQLVNRGISKTCMRHMALSCMLPACVSCTPLELRL
jgi:hypothetical protein